MLAEINFDKVIRVLNERHIQITNEYIRLITAKLRERFQKMILIIDNLDKLSPGNYRNYEIYFRTSQGFYEELNSTDGFFYIVFSMQNFVATFSSKQISFLDDERITVSNWTKNELLELVSKRMKYALEDPSKFFLRDFVDERVLSFVFGVSDFNPRDTIIATMKLLQKAYEYSKEPEYQDMCKPIREEFLKEFSSYFVEKTGHMDFKIIEQLAQEKHGRAFRLLTETLRDNRVFVYEIITMLLNIWRGTKFDEKSTIVILLIEKLVGF